MKKLHLFTIILIAFLFSCGDLVAQQHHVGRNKRGKTISTYRGRKVIFPKAKRYNSIGISINAFNYFGDLAPKPTSLSTDFSFTRPGIGFIFNHRFGPRYTLRTSLTWGRLKADDYQDSPDPTDFDNYPRHVRNLHFRNDIIELAVTPIFDLFENQSTAFNRVKWTPYAFVGVAVLYSNPTAVAPETDLNGAPLAEAGDWVALQPLKTEGKLYSKIQIAIPVGLGVRFKLPGNFDLSAEIGYRYLLTDYIDDVSQDYVDLGSFTGSDKELAQAMSYRSHEMTAAQKEEPRDLTEIGSVYSEITYTSAIDGQDYTVWSGFGQGGDETIGRPADIRGSPSDNDIYIVTSFQLSYIIGGRIGRAKFR